LTSSNRKLFEIAGRAYELLKDELRIDKYDEIVAILGGIKRLCGLPFSIRRGVYAQYWLSEIPVTQSQT